MLDATRRGRGAAVVLVVLSALVAGGCASADEGGGSSTASTTSPGEAAPTGGSGSGGTAGGSSDGASASGTPSLISPSSRAVSVVVKGGKATVEPKELRVAEGEPVVIKVTTDRDNVLHVHGVDLEQQLEAGVATTINVSFPDPGVYEVELHDPELLLLDVTVGAVGG